MPPDGAVRAIWNVFCSIGTMEAIKAKGERVRISTSSKQNYKIDNELKSEISFYGSQGKAAIDARLKNLTAHGILNGRSR